jgi:hypothetical protein
VTSNGVVLLPPPGQLVDGQAGGRAYFGQWRVAASSLPPNWRTRQDIAKNMSMNAKSAGGPVVDIDCDMRGVTFHFKDDALQYIEMMRPNVD